MNEDEDQGALGRHRRWDRLHADIATYYAGLPVVAGMPAADVQTSPSWRSPSFVVLFPDGVGPHVWELDHDWRMARLLGDEEAENHLGDDMDDSFPGWRERFPFRYGPEARRPRTEEEMRVYAERVLGWKKPSGP